MHQSSDQEPRTRLYIAGGPGGGSIGPPIHDHIAQSLNLPWKCQFLQLSAVEEVMAYFRASGFAGGLVTMPHKRSIIPLLSQCDDLVRIMGACNCVYLGPDGELRGTNTDWVGIYDAILAQSSDHPPGKTGMVYGAGGASRAAIYTLWEKLKCDKIYVVNRDDKEVIDLLEELRQQPGSYQPDIIHVRSTAEAANLPSPHYIISTVPDFEPKSPQEVEARNILVEFMSRKESPRGLLMDMCYHPPMTRILKLGVEYGYEIIHGHTVVASQFSTQWKLWTGKDIQTQEAFEMTELLVREKEAKTRNGRDHY